MKIDIPDPAGADAYPIVTFTWELLRNVQEDTAKDQAIRAFTRWAVTEGQELAPGTRLCPDAPGGARPGRSRYLRRFLAAPGVMP